MNKLDTQKRNQVTIPVVIHCGKWQQLLIYLKFNLHPKVKVKAYVLELHPCYFNSLLSSNAIWWHRSGSTLAQVMACCLMAPSHYLNHCWLIITGVRSNPRALSKGLMKLILSKLSVITLSKLLPHLPGAKELSHPFTFSRMASRSLSVSPLRRTLCLLSG